jgi:general secretion pathway protein B
MSYILEALKKLERKRQQEEKRPTLTLADAAMPKARPRALWLTLVAVGLILNAMVLVWWIIFRGPYQPPRSAPKLPQRALVKPVPAAVLPPVTSPAQDADRRKTAPERTPTPTGTKGPEDRKTSGAPPEKLPVSVPVKTAIPAEKRPAFPATPKSPVNPPSPGPIQARVPATEPVKTPPPPDKKASTSDQGKVPLQKPSKTAVPPSDRVFNLNDLPADVRSALPPLKISAHVYSLEPQSRLVQVNGQLLQEGQVSTEGLKVEEIYPKGIVFRFQGYRFRMGIQ